MNRKISAASARAHTRKSRQSSSFRLPSGGCSLIFYLFFFWDLFSLYPFFFHFFFIFLLKLIYIPVLLLLYCFSNCLHNQIERMSDQNVINWCGKALLRRGKSR